MFDPETTAVGTVPAPRTCEVRVGDAAELLPAMPDRAVDLVFTSPPYSDCRTYEEGAGGKKFKLRGQAWVDWLAPIVADCCRVSAGLVFVNAAGPVRKFSYEPIVEWLVADLTREFGVLCGPSPFAWVKAAGIPGSGGRKYQRRDWEPVYCFALPDRLPPPWTDNTAFGHPPKWAPGGEMSNRLSNGARVNQWGGHETSSRTRKSDGTMQDAGRPSHVYPSGNPPSQANAFGGPNGSGGARRASRKVKPSGGSRPLTGGKGKRLERGNENGGAMAVPVIANPGNVIRTNVGGNHMGHRKAHAGEAPMPEALAERFVCWYAPPGGIVLDPFAGTGTTLAAAARHGRRGLGFELRPHMADIARRRLATTQAGLF